MPRRCGIDTAIVVRLATGEPAQDFDRVVAALTHLVALDHVALLSPATWSSARPTSPCNTTMPSASPMRRTHCAACVSSGLVTAWGGDLVLDALATNRGCGLLDRLIALQYGADDLSTLTLDRKMAALPNVTRLASRAAGR